MIVSEGDLVQPDCSTLALPSPPLTRVTRLGGRGRARSLVAMYSVHVGVVGATGQVGGVMRHVLAERDFPVASSLLRLGALGRAGAAVAGRRGRGRGTATPTTPASSIALFSAGGDVRRSWLPGWRRPAPP